MNDEKKIDELTKGIIVCEGMLTRLEELYDSLIEAAEETTNIQVGPRLRSVAHRLNQAITVDNDELGLLEGSAWIGDLLARLDGEYDLDDESPAQIVWAVTVPTPIRLELIERMGQDVEILDDLDIPRTGLTTLFVTGCKRAVEHLPLLMDGWYRREAYIIEDVTQQWADDPFLNDTIETISNNPLVFVDAIRATRQVTQDRQEQIGYLADELNYTNREAKALLDWALDDDGFSTQEFRRVLKESSWFDEYGHRLTI